MRCFENKQEVKFRLACKPLLPYHIGLYGKRKWIYLKFTLAD
jgi:hypothetical protein